MTQAEARQKAIAEVRDGVEDLRSAWRRKMEFERKHRNVLNQYEDICAAVTDAKDYLAESIRAANLDAVDDPKGELIISYYQQDRGEYDAEKLPPDVRDNPEVTRLTAPKENVERAVKVGWLTQAQAEAAWNENKTKPTIRFRPVIRNMEGNRDG